MHALLRLSTEVGSKSIWHILSVQRDGRSTRGSGFSRPIDRIRCAPFQEPPL